VLASRAELGRLAGHVQHTRDVGVDAFDEDSISEFVGVQLNAARDGSGRNVSVVVGSVRAWNSLILLR
jgi:hypothetical protein